jgi:CheY-like chemotaxis protein
MVNDYSEGAKMVKILIIEDDPYVQRVFKRMFYFKKYETEMASSGEEGLAIAKKTKPNLILLDIILPEMDGLVVLKKLKADPQTKKIPVLVLTNVAGDEKADEAIKLGAESYMVKVDFSPTQVLAEIDKYLKYS